MAVFSLATMAALANALALVVAGDADGALVSTAWMFAFVVRVSMELYR